MENVENAENPQIFDYSLIYYCCIIILISLNKIEGTYVRHFRGSNQQHISIK